MADEIKWKWYWAPAFQIGWDCAFQAPADLLQNLEKYERIPVRGFGKLDIVKSKTEPVQPVLQYARNLPGSFGAMTLEQEGRIDRKMFSIICEVTDAAAEDWTKEWTEPTQALDLIDGGNVPADELEALAKSKAQQAKMLRKGPQGLLK